MPIWLRNFTFNSIKEHFEKEKAKNDSIQDKGTKRTIAKNGIITNPESIPKINTPTYISKPKKPQ